MKTIPPPLSETSPPQTITTAHKKKFDDPKRAIRFWRGIALILMILYHFVFDLYYFFQLTWFGNPFQGFWLTIARISAILFILLAGAVTAGIQQSFSPQAARRKNFLRAGKIFLCAAGITLITQLFFPETAIYLGILHFLGLAIFCTACFRLSWRAAFGGALVFLVIHEVLPPLSFSPLAILLGQAPADFRSLDYFPFFPWFSLFLSGIALENLRRIYKLPLSTGIFSFPPLEWLGHHSLWIYLLHQPIILGMIYFVQNVFK